MKSSMTSAFLFASLLTTSFRATVIATGNVVAVGDDCGVNGANFLDPSFSGNVLVAPSSATDGGCTFGEETECFCAPVLDDSQQFGPWKWQCNTEETPDAVPFGPPPGKQCPSTIPVERGLGNVPRPVCDLSMNPSGAVGDPACPYSDCEGTGTSALCGCIDLAFVGEEGSAWFCLHSTCECPKTTEESRTDPPSSSSRTKLVTVSFVSFVPLLLLIC